MFCIVDGEVLEHLNRIMSWCVPKYSEYGDNVAMSIKRENMLLETKLKFLAKQEAIGLHVLQKTKNDLAKLQESINDFSHLLNGLQRYDQWKEKIRYGKDRSKEKTQNKANGILARKTNNQKEQRKLWIVNSKPKPLSLRQLKKLHHSEKRKSSKAKWIH